MPPDSFSSALGQLDPASRALLDLSLRRGMRPDEIAEMLGAEADSVAVTRDEALRRVAAAVGMSGDDQLDEVRARLAELPAEDWLRSNGNGVAGDVSAPDAPAEEPGLAEDAGDSAPADRGDTAARGARAEDEARSAPTDNVYARIAAAEAAAAAAAPARERPPRDPAATSEPERDDARERRRNLIPVLLAALGVAVVAAVFIGSSLDSDEEQQPGSPPPAAEQPEPEPSQPEQPPEPRPEPPPRVDLTAVADSGGEGTARLTNGGRRLELRVRGLPDPGSDSYSVWLYDSIIDARRLGNAGRGRFELNAKLPPAARRYRFVDVSLERADGNVSHSGRSVARVRLAQLR